MIDELRDIEKLEEALKLVQGETKTEVRAGLSLLDNMIEYKKRLVEDFENYFAIEE